ncbi:helix-turn-helix transcriptional regulator [Actinoplanes derwentensis]|uniref:Predicted DNA-binding transcriptional regulator YafY, contains an HTH and WYL domains n=1 Tax=Actinoplanes derwentensis TaxID=113562 RepID=A0A1H1U3J6_9ACTN|nr:YafY family protein [Actinoplanes derwentensis]GID85183.1 transcriptional regulator [Actinoplanes derwentensis]SDS66964.1 Predicted DNA-binding transcriptional regulator YafY, contains an HTH and WYL domains [Actinoplanes derwentensis]
MPPSLGRVLGLLELLQASPAGHTVGRLATQLGVDERTVRRYAAHLTDLGIPVEGRRGRYGGYVLSPGYRLPPLMLTDDEALAVLLGLVAGRRTGLTTTSAAAETALAKIQRVLPKGLRARTDALLSTLDFTGPAPTRVAEPAEPAPANPARRLGMSSATLLTFAGATDDRQPVTFDYTKPGSEPSERRLDPYGLVFHSGKWFVTGHDHDRATIRTFRLDRITRPRLLDGCFEVPPGFDPGAQVAAGLATGNWHHQVSVLLHTDLAQAKRRIPPSVATLTSTPSGVRMTTGAERLDGMAQMLAGLGYPFTIESPPELKSEVAALATRLQAML